MGEASKYSLIAGHGRSGTNWLLDILDASPETFCRNEPNEVHDSPCRKLEPLWCPSGEMDDMAKYWDEIAHWMSNKMGERDHRLTTPKSYVHPLSQKTGIAFYPARPRIRVALRLIFPEIRKGEWDMPWWVGDREKLARSHSVLKINQSARIAVWLLKHRPEIPVLHIVRHPGGRLNSWLNRFFAERDEAQIAQRNRDRLRQVLDVSPEWQDAFGDIDAMSIAESEMWFWRYVTENIHVAGEGQQKYMLLLYENLSQDPVGTAKRVYDFCSLNWSSDVEALVRQGTSESVWGKVPGTPQSVAQAWKKKLAPHEVDAVNKVLCGSFMESWWS